MVKTRNNWAIDSIRKSILFVGNGCVLSCSSEGEVWGFGEKYFLKEKIPIKVPLLENIIDITSSDKIVYCIDHHGKVWQFDSSEAPRTLEGNWITKPSVFPCMDIEILSISCGGNHTCFLSIDLQVYGIGSNLTGQLGYGDVEKLKTIKKIPNVSNIYQISCGHTFTYLLGENGKIYNSGWNLSGQLGNGNKMNQNFFLPMIDESNIISISCGEFHVLFLVDNGKVFSCGSSKDGALGLGVSVKEVVLPCLIAELESIVQISCQSHNSFCLDASGNVFCFGEYNGLDYPEKLVNIPPMNTISSFAFCSSVAASVLSEVYTQHIVLKDMEGNLWSGISPSGTTCPKITKLDEHHLYSTICGVRNKLVKSARK